MTFKIGQIAYDNINKFYVIVEGRKVYRGELRYYDVAHYSENQESRYAAGVNQLRPLTKREIGI